MNELKLNLGCGPKELHLDEWKNIDIDPNNQADETYDIAIGLNEASKTVDEILISHTLMYFGYREIAKILRECLRVLKEGGILRVTEDNGDLKTRNDKQQAQYHYQGRSGDLFNRYEMQEFIRENGFVQVREAEPFEENKHHLNPPDHYALPRGRAAVFFIIAQKPLSTKAPNITLFLDDFGEHNSNMDLLWRLRNYFDDFKITVFAIPNDNLNASWTNYIFSLEWIRFGLHGYHHTHHEELDPKILRIMPTIGFKRIYRPPYLELTPKMKKILVDEGYRIIMKHNWRIDAEPPTDIDDIIGYGHVYPHDYRGPKGGRGESLFLYWNNIMKLPRDTNFQFIKEIGEE